MIQMKYVAGFGKAEMTAFVPGVGMMGYGQLHNVVKDIATPLWARAMILNTGDKTIYWAHLEQAFVTMAIKEEIAKRLSVSEQDLIITAQHTHSAPGGYSHYPFYNLTIPNFQTKVFNIVCGAIIEAFESAKSNLSEVEIFWGNHHVAPDKEIAFNRSFTSFLQNNDAPKLNSEDKHLGVNREMEALMFKNSEGHLKAIFHWFGVHCTSVSSFNQRIHYDNKGVAAELFEKKYPTTVAFFLQAAAGDVSPNFIWDKKLKRMRGKFADQYESTAYNGELQFKEAEQIMAKEKITGAIKTTHAFKNMAQDVASPAHGVAFFQGTLEGPGIHKTLGAILKQVARWVRSRKISQGQQELNFYQAQDPKDILLDHRTGSFLGIPLSVWKRLPPLPEPTMELFRQTAKKDALNTLPWVPGILPIQTLEIGPLLIALVPGEITTNSAKRLKQELMKIHQERGITRVIISSYANAYMGYITTPEEYRTQSYEAGHTVYGIGTHQGIVEGFKQLAISSQLSAPYFRFPQDELSRRST